MTVHRSLRISLWVTAAIVTVLLVFSKAASAESAGRTLYGNYCASCHGIDGRGNGPVAGALKVQPPDLTRLERRFGMPLDRDKIAEYVDGRLDVLSHGPRDMPVWGRQLKEGMIGQPATEDTTRRTIDAIVNYLVSIQQIVGAVR